MCGNAPVYMLVGARQNSQTKCCTTKARKESRICCWFPDKSSIHPKGLCTQAVDTLALEHPQTDYFKAIYKWVVVKIRVPFWVPIIIRHLLFRVSKKGP